MNTKLAKAMIKHGVMDVIFVDYDNWLIDDIKSMYPYIYSFNIVLTHYECYFKFEIMTDVIVANSNDNNNFILYRDTHSYNEIIDIPRHYIKSLCEGVEVETLEFSTGISILGWPNGY